MIAGYIIRPLSSHIRTHDFDLSRPLTTLSFTGTFSISEAHAWLHQLIPNIPLKCPPSDSITNNFQCVTNGGTLLQVIYSKGSAIFRSDCLTTISIIRDRVTEETMSKQVRVDVSCDLNEESVFHCLKLLDPKMTHLINLEKQKILASALKELEANNSDVFSFLSSGNAELLRNYDRIHEEAENMKIDDTGIIQIYRNLLTCRAKLNGKPIRGKLEGLEEILRDNYSLENVVEYFRKAND
ncbi:unnamed protein product [Caenorhabditis angaria]|uniref:Uncharacterized protein n=1 Tax=Caenorhabditis angaria TaxID=860376 RepID=A0A9P1IE36_9PELO|nr:unnamed protein product [Caenorhabditis angaria]